MDVSSLAAAMAGAQIGRLQLAAAAKMMKMNADGAADAAKLLEAASQNMKSLANVGSGVGGNLDITV